MDRPFQAVAAMRLDRPDCFRSISIQKPEIEIEVDLPLPDRSMVIHRTFVVVNMNFRNMGTKCCEPLFEPYSGGMEQVPVANVETVAKSWMAE